MAKDRVSDEVFVSHHPLGPHDLAKNTVQVRVQKFKGHAKPQ